MLTALVGAAATDTMRRVRGLGDAATPSLSMASSTYPVSFFHRDDAAAPYIHSESARASVGALRAAVAAVAAVGSRRGAPDTLLQLIDGTLMPVLPSLEVAVPCDTWAAWPALSGRLLRQCTMPIIVADPATGETPTREQLPSAVREILEDRHLDSLMSSDAQRTMDGGGSPAAASPVVPPARAEDAARGGRLAAALFPWASLREDAAACFRDDPDSNESIFGEMTLQPTVICALPADLAVFPLVRVLQENAENAQPQEGSGPPTPPHPSAAATHTAALMWMSPMFEFEAAAVTAAVNRRPERMRPAVSPVAEESAKTSVELLTAGGPLSLVTARRLFLVDLPAAAAAVHVSAALAQREALGANGDRAIAELDLPLPLLRAWRVLADRALAPAERDVAALNGNAVWRGSGAHAALHNITRDVFGGCYFPKRAHIFRGLHEAGVELARAILPSLRGGNM
jgi:hypothetical protein